VRFGLDISHHQSLDVVPWASLLANNAFIYVRATYGTTRDKRVLLHVEKARELGLTVGLYHFFRPSRPVVEQFETFATVADECAIGAGDLLPALDIEADPVPTMQHVSPAWDGPARKLCEMFVDTWGDAVIYMTQREWGMLGKPTWVLEHPLWVAHYTPRASPATPGGAPWSIWQYRVGRYDADPNNRSTDARAPRALDHNMATEPLPMIARPSATPVQLEPEPTIPYLGLSDDDWAAMRNERDERIRGDQ
jgi:GH25 family lysozyme M1 (1,4-beta-N-acetylmuramidase)